MVLGVVVVVGVVVVGVVDILEMRMVVVTSADTISGLSSFLESGLN